MKIKSLITTAVVALLALPAPASAHVHKHHHHRPQAHHSVVAPPNSDPIALALQAAYSYWHNVPCGGDVQVRMGTASEVTLVSGTEHEVDAWATFTGAAGPNNVEAPPSSYTACVVSLNPNVFTDTETDDDNYEALCQLMAHEIGHFEGYADTGAKPGTIQYVFADSAPLIPQCQHYDLVFTEAGEATDHFRSEAQEAAIERAAAARRHHHK